MEIMSNGVQFVQSVFYNWRTPPVTHDRDQLGPEITCSRLRAFFFPPLSEMNSEADVVLLKAKA